jgi:hypothetical protein
MNLFSRILATFCLVFTFAVVVPSSSAQIPTSEDLFNRSDENDRKSDFFKDTPLVDYTGTTRDLSDARIAEAGQFQFRFIVERVINFIKQAAIPAAVLLLVVGGVGLIFAGGDEEALTQRKNQLIGTAMGFGLFTLAVTLVDSVFFGQQGEIFRFGTTNDQFAAIDQCRTQGIDLAQCSAYVDYTQEFGNRFGAQLLALFNFLSSFLVGIAVLFMVLGGFQIMTASGDEAISKAKQRLINSSLGMFMVLIFQQIYKVLVRNGQIKVPYGRDILELAGGWLNFVIGTIGFLSVIGLIYGGLRLLTGFGDEASQTTAKTIILGAVMGLIVTASAFTVASYLGTAL